ncbi:MAG: 4-hydroxybenzoate transporter [Gammaproteobacteria bacterium]|nr:MAG: 4-hydroxybenzoate transporter [Gammaproteobacteria bacterium]
MSSPEQRQSPRSSVPIVSVIDEAPVSRYQLFIAGLCLLVGIIDGFENGAIAYVAPALANDLSIPLGDIGQIFAAGTIGMMCGTLIMGIFADYWGRKRAILLSVAVFGVAALGTAVATDKVTIMIWRFVAGIAIGGVHPVMIALLAEYFPARHRNMAIVVGFVGMGIGVPISALLTSAVVPDYGWRAIFVLGGGVPLLLLPWLAWVYPESLRFLLNRKSVDRGRIATALNRIVGDNRYTAEDHFELIEEPAPRASGRALLAPKYRRTTLIVWIVYFFNWITWYLFLLWMPTALTESGFSIRQASLAGAVMGVTAIIAFIPAGGIIQRVGIRHSLLWLFAGGVVSSGLLSLVGADWALVAMLVVPFTICGVIPQVALNYLAAELYPTTIRATGLGWAISAGRVGSVIGALIGGTLIGWWGLSGFFMTLGVPLLIVGVLTAFFFNGKLLGNH